MYLKSLYPPVPSLPSTNYHNVILGGLAQSEVPDHVMQIDALSGEKRTRSEFIERVHDCGTALGASKEAGGLGLTSNDMVGILSDNCLDYIVLVHSLLALATPFALLSSFATPREMAYSLTKTKATHLFVHGSLYKKFLTVARENGFPDSHIYILEGSLNATTSPPTLGQLIWNARQQNIPREPVRNAEKNTLAYLVFSSGTSGLPKALMVTHGNLVFSLIQGQMMIQEGLKVTNPPPDANSVPTVLSYLPFFHSYGLHYTILKAPSTPATHIVMPRWNLDMALSLIPKYRVTTIPAVPSIIYQLANSPQFKKINVSSIESIISAAAYLPPKLREYFKKLVPSSMILSEGYGLSEATLAIMMRPLSGMLDGRVEPIHDSCGILLPGMEVMILRPDGTHCLPNEAGELYAKGDNVTLGYWHDKEETKKTYLETGWVRTGDILRADENGNFWFEDRLKDTLKVSGLQVSPAEIEDVLLAIPSGLVKDVAVAGVQAPGARTSDDRSPRAWVVLSPQGLQLGETEARRVLEKWAQENLSRYKWLRGGIQFVHEVPKSQTGKILRRILQDEYASQMSSRPKL